MPPLPAALGIKSAPGPPSPSPFFWSISAYIFSDKSMSSLPRHSSPTPLLLLPPPVSFSIRSLGHRTPSFPSPPLIFRGTYRMDHQFVRRAAPLPDPLPPLAKMSSALLSAFPRSVGGTDGRSRFLVGCSAGRTQRAMRGRGRTATYVDVVFHMPRLLEIIAVPR